MIIGEVERVKKRISIVLIVVMMLELVGCEEFRRGFCGGEADSGGRGDQCRAGL
mgnify:CR=1 FL=1